MVIIKGSNITVNSNNCTFNFTESDYVNGTIEQDMFLVDIGMNSIRDNINIKKLPTRVSSITEEDNSNNKSRYKIR